MRRSFWLALLLVLLCAVPVMAEDAPVDEDMAFGTILFRVENDKFGGGTDQYYTNGMFLSWISPDIERWEDDNRLHHWITDFANAMPFVNGEGVQRSVALSMGHSIFTPQDTSVSDPDPDDRPYAGWLYGSLGLHSKTATELDVFETTIGIVGPSAMGEQVQNNFHDLIEVMKAHGWSHQLHDEPGLMVTWQHSWRMWLGAEDPAKRNGWGLDFIPHAGATLGNIYTYANAGAEIRVGWNLPANFGTSLIGPAAGVSAPMDGGCRRDDFGIHVFLGTDGRAVARNIFLDGNTFQESRSVAKRVFVADIFGGVSMNWKNVTVTYTQATRTKEFYGQNKRHVFGSLSMAVSF